MSGSEIIGGPLGRHARTGGPYRTWWTPLRVLLAALFLSSSLSLIVFSHCREADWRSPDMYVHACYSESAVLYQSAGLDQHRNPFTAFEKQSAMTYPILANLRLWAASWLVPSGTASERRLIFFDLFALTSIVAWVVTSLLVARLALHWRDALLVALAPAAIVVMFTGWEAVTALLTMLSIYFLRKDLPIIAGAMIGLAMLHSIYPVILLLGLYLTVSGFARIALSALGVWLGVTLLVQIFFGSGFAAFAELFRGGAGYGSLWYVISTLVIVGNLNLWWLITVILGVLGLTFFIAMTQRQPTVAQGLFAAALVYFFFAKSFGPQQLLFLIPLAVLAGVTWRDFVIWQFAAVTYHVLLWQYIATVSQAPKGLPANAYTWVVVLHLATLAFLFIRTVQAMPINRSTVAIEEKQYQN